jgi:hypothetical protein
MMRKVLVMCAALLQMASTGASLAQEQKVDVIVIGTLNTMGRLFPNPTSADPIARSTSYSYADFYGVGAEVQYHFANSNVSLGLSSEYIRNSGGRNIAATGQTVVPVEDSYQVIPVELTGYFRIPVMSGTFSIFMGGGAGVYFGDRYYVVAGIAAPTTESRPGFGIHVLSGLAYRVTPWLSASLELKFRDAQFETTNAFKAASVRYHGILVPLSLVPFTSSIHTDGMVIQLGLGISL